MGFSFLIFLEIYGLRFLGFLKTAVSYQKLIYFAWFTIMKGVTIMIMRLLNKKGNIFKTIDRKKRQILCLECWFQ